MLNHNKHAYNELLKYTNRATGMIKAAPPSKS